ncbi:MAG: PKD domain-containing protein [Gammaproteobacteria bacterium]|nr:PKD domain-containing protein [Gammaproteobacteria bacterium]
MVRLDARDAQVLPDRPRAVAGFSRSAGGRLRLDGALSSDPGLLPLVHRWVLDGEAAPRDGEFPCIDDLEPGRYRATLVVDNGVHIDADALHFTIAPPPLAAVENGPVPSDAEPLHLTADVPLSMDCSDAADPAPEPEGEGGEEGEEAADEEGEGAGDDAGPA